MSHSVQRFLISHACMILCYALLLAISILIQDVEFSIYGEIVYSETAEWNKKPLTVLQSSTNGCPAGTTQVTSFYLGLHTICKKDDTSYFIETCSKQPGYRTQYGLPESTLKSYDSVSLCYQRTSKAFTFQQFIESVEQFKTNRICGENYVQCGSGNWTYCLTPNSTCPLNDVQLVQKNDTASIQYYRNQGGYTEVTDFSEDFTLFTSTSKDALPYVEFYVNLSPPCAFQVDKFVYRPHQIDAIFQNGTCSFTHDNNQVHTSFKNSGFGISELDMIKDNGLYNKVKSLVPSYNEEKLKLNNYNLYSKPYASWSIECSEMYPPEEVAKSSKIFLQIENWNKGLYVQSYLQLSLNVVALALLMFLRQEHQKDNYAFYQRLQKYAMGVSIFLHSIVFILYIVLLAKIQSINEEQLNFFIDHNCTQDSVLSYSFVQILSETQYYKTLTVVGLCFTVLFGFLYLFLMLCSFQIILPTLKRKQKDKQRQLNSPLIKN